MNLEVHPEVAGIAEGLAAVFTLVGFHSHMPHEVHIELSGSYKTPGAHAALIFLLPHVPLAFCSGVIRVSTTIAPTAAAVVVSVRLPRGVVVAGPWGRGRAGGSVGQFLLLVSVLLWLLFLLLLWRLLLLLLLLQELSGSASALVSLEVEDGLRLHRFLSSFFGDCLYLLLVLALNANASSSLSFGLWL